MQEIETKPQYIYAIRDKETGKIVNRKGHSANSFYTRKGFAATKLIEGKEEVVTYELKEFID